MKPVQRRILFAMNEMRLAATPPNIPKSARVVGDGSVRYHLHGDTSGTTPWCASPGLLAALSAETTARATSARATATTARPYATPGVPA